MILGAVGRDIESFYFGMYNRALYDLTDRHKSPLNLEDGDRTYRMKRAAVRIVAPAEAVVATAMFYPLDAIKRTAFYVVATKKRYLLAAGGLAFIADKCF